MIEEIWRRHYIYKDLLISNYGRVKFPPTTKFGNNYITYGSPNERGYLCIFHNKKLLRVHRLVAECFIPNPDNKPYVDHIIPINQGGTNRVDNLRWVTHKENCNNKNTINYKKKNYTNKPKPVLVYLQDGNFFNEYISISETSRDLNIHTSIISKVLQGIRKSTHGFIFKYKI